jgi:hypothetical protein
MALTEQLKIYKERIEECKAKLTALSPQGHPKSAVLDSFLDQVVIRERFTYSQADYLRCIENEADQLEALKGTFERYQRGCGTVTTKAIIKALQVGLDLSKGYNDLAYSWKRSNEDMRRVLSTLLQGNEITLTDWAMLHKLKKFDNIIDAYAAPELFHAGQLVQLRASVNSSNIGHGRHFNWRDRNDFWNNRREMVATVIAYDQKPINNAVVTNSHGSPRLVTILPIGSVCPAYVMERDLKKVPSKVIAGGGQ